jgi:hypothetical protein
LSGKAHSLRLQRYCDGQQQVKASLVPTKLKTPPAWALRPSKELAQGKGSCHSQVGDGREVNRS